MEILGYIKKDQACATAGVRMKLADFKCSVDDSGFMPDDGIIGDVLVDNHHTNIYVQDWGWDVGESFALTLEELEQIEGVVEIIWFNK